MIEREQLIGVDFGEKDGDYTVELYGYFINGVVYITREKIIK